MIVKSREAVEAMDRFARKRLDNINDLLETENLSTDHTNEIDSIVAKMATEFEKSDLEGRSDPYEEMDDEKAASKKTPSKKSRGEKAAEDHSPKPDIRSALSPNTTEPSIFSLEFLWYRSRLIRLNGDNEDRILLLAEKTRLEQSLATSSLAKGLYLKRCNGEFISVLNDVLPDSHSEIENEETKEGSQEADDGLGEMNIKHCVWIEDGEEKVLTSRDKSPDVDKMNPLDTPGRGDLAKDFHDKRSVTDLLSSVTEQSNSSDSSDDSDDSSTTVTMSNSTTPTIAVFTAVQNSANLPSRPQSPLSAVAIINTLEKGLRISPSVIDQSTTTTCHPVYDTQTTFGYAVPSGSSKDTIPPSSPQQFKYSAGIQLRNEAMALSGTVTKEDLIVTSWSFNREVKVLMAKDEEQGER